MYKEKWMNELRSFLVSSLCRNLSPPSSDVPILTGKYLIVDAQENYKNKNQKKSIILWIRLLNKDHLVICYGLMMKLAHAPCLALNKSASQEL